MSVLKMNLLENAKSFLCEALAKACEAEQNVSEWKFAILHVVQCVELLLKERLRREHRSLVFTNIDKQVQTVPILLAGERLEKIVGITFDHADKKAMRSASKLRNEIVHSAFEIVGEAAKANMAVLLGFVSHFSKQELQMELHELIEDQAMLQRITAIMDYSKELMRRLEKRFDEEGIDTDCVLACSACGLDSFVAQDEINTCFICGHQDDTVNCEKCGGFDYEENMHEREEFVTKWDTVWVYYCDKCYEELREREREREREP